MFCFQCEQTQVRDNQVGCAGQQGSCGKNSTTSDLQDILVYLIQGIAQYQQLQAKTVDPKVAEFVLHGLFTTLTNVNFNAAQFVQLIQQAAALRDELKQERRSSIHIAKRPSAIYSSNFHQ